MTTIGDGNNHEPNALSALTEFHDYKDRPQSLTLALFVSFAEFQMAVKERLGNAARTEQALQELILWMYDPKQLDRMLRPSDVTQALPLMVEPTRSRLIAPEALANIVPRVDDLRHLMTKAIDVVDAHQKYLNFDPMEMAQLQSVESMVFRRKRARLKPKPKVPYEKIVNAILERGWGKPGVKKDQIKLEVSELLKVSESHIQDVARKHGLTDTKG